VKSPRSPRGRGQLAARHERVERSAGAPEMQVRQVEDAPHAARLRRRLRAGRRPRAHRVDRQPQGVRIRIFSPSQATVRGATAWRWYLSAADEVEVRAPRPCFAHEPEGLVEHADPPVSGATRREAPRRHAVRPASPKLSSW
jgi:hypothetical protein